MGGDVAEDVQETEQQVDDLITEEEIGALMQDNYEIGLTSAEINYYNAMKEIGCCAYDGDNESIKEN